MNMYEIQQNILFNNLKNLLLNDAIYQNFKYKLNNLIKENNNFNEKDINKIKEIIKLIKQPQQLLNKDVNIIFSFFNSPKIDHEIFKPLLSSLNSINDIIKTINNNTQIQLIDQFKIYSESQIEFCQHLVKKIKQKSNKKQLKYLDELPLLYIENYGKYEVKSTQLAYKMASYDPVQYCYIKKNNSGHSIGTVINDVYLKYIRGGQLKPAKEFAIYQLYKDLFPLSSSAFVTPTQLIVLDNLKILNEDSPILRKLGSLKAQNNQQDIEIILEKHPEFRIELINTLEKSQPFFILSSLLVKGQTLEKILEDKFDFKYEQIDMESYSAHIIASLLVIHSDYKADNLILEEGTNRIIGIDNDESLCDFELIGNKTQIRNTLFTFKTLMDKPIYQSVREQFVKHDPYIFIFKWLLQLESKQLEYEQFIHLVYEFKIFNDENQKQTILNNKKYELNIPLVFTKNWIPSMLNRFKKIKNFLESEESITHQQLFQSIHPTSYSYYEYLLNKHHNNPLDILYDLYISPINDNIIDKIKNNIEEYLPNIKESVLELIKSKDYDEIEDSKILNQWMFLVFDYLKTNQIEDFQFHKSWYSNNINIFFKILKNGFSKDLLESIISRLNITDIDRVFSFIIHNLSNLNVCDNIEFLINNFKMDIADLENNEYLINAKSLLDMALNFNNLKGNFKLFLAFLKHGSNKSIDEIKFNNFYQTLSHEQKLELKPYLTKLFNINNKINWITSMNQLLPIKNDLLDQNNNTKILTTINGDKRIISDNYWRKIHLTDAKPSNNNDNDIRPIVFIEDEYGNGIYVKSSIQSPGTEIAINKLSDLLFGFLTPICELASIDNIPILLIQYIPGVILNDAILKDKDIINKIEPSNLSKQLVFAMITNSGDGNLANFIVVKNNFKSYNIYSINNDKSITPSISKSIGYFKNSEQVETVLLLFNQMNDKVHQDVINCLKKIDVNKTLNNWLILLKPQHDLAIAHFNSNNKNNNKNIIGISFHDGMISQLYSKLQRIKQILNKPESSTTHLNIFEIIEPLVNDRYKPIISLNISIHEKLTILKNNKFVTEKSLTSSTHTSLHLLDSRSIQNAGYIDCQMGNGKYGPSQALDELKSLNNLFLNSKNIIENIRNFDNNQSHISKYDLECFLKSNFIEINEKSILNKLYELIKLKELSIIYLRNNNDLNINTIYQFNLDSIVKLDLSGCNMLKSLEKSLIQVKFKIFFKSLIKLNLKNCSQLNSIRIYAPVLKSLNTMDCKQLKTLDVEIPNVEYLNLKGSISEFYIDISKTLEKFKKIEYLNLSETDYKTLTINLENLKSLDIISIKNLKEIYFETPSIESINFEGCHNLKQVKSLTKDNNINLNLMKILYDVESVFNFSISIYPIKYLNNKLLISDFYFPESMLSKVKDLNICQFFYQFETIPHGNSSYVSKIYNPLSTQSFTFGYFSNQPLSPGTIPSNVQSLKFGNCFDQPLSPGTIPSSVQSLTFGGFNQPLSSGTIPSSVQSLKFGYSFNQTLSSGIIPSSVQSLTFGYYFNQPLSRGIIPSSVQSLTFDYHFNTPLSSGTIPSSVQSLTFGHCFDQPLSPGTIPSSVQSLTFGHDFNQTLSPDTIPSSVQSLTFGDDFNQPLSPGIIPSSVQSLTFGGDFNQPLSPGTIPSSVQSLTFGKHFNQPLSPGIIPSSVQSLKFGDCFDQPLSPGTIPSSVQSLTLSGFNQPLSPGIIPSSVQSLTFYYCFNLTLSPGTIPSSVQSLMFDFCFNLTLWPGTIPSSVQSLTFGFHFNQPLSPGTIPSSVKSLTFGFHFNQPLSPGTIPSSVQSLTFGVRFDQPLSPGTIPSNVQSLTFGKHFDQPLSPGTIPSSVQSLTFGYYFDQPLSPGIIPSSVQSLTFGYYFNQPLSPGIIPSSVQSLTFGTCFNQPLSPGIIPSSVQSLTFGKSFNQPLSSGTIPSSVQSLTVMNTVILKKIIK